LGELRWILLVIGIVAIAAIWWWTARRSRQAPGNAELREPTLSPLSLTPALGDTPPSAAERRAASAELRTATGSRGAVDTRPASEARGERAGSERVGNERAGNERAGSESREWGIPPLQPLSIRAADFEDVPSLEEPMLTSADPIDFSLDSSRATGGPRFPSHASAVSPPEEPELREHPEEAEPEEIAPASTPARKAAFVEHAVPTAQVASAEHAVPTVQVASAEHAIPTAHVASAVQLGAAVHTASAAQAAAAEHATSASRPTPAAQSAPPELAASPSASTARWRPASENSDRYSTAAPQVPNMSDKQKIVALRVCAVGDARWTGAGLISALEMHGLAYGRYQVFHRRHSDGRSIFCVASLVEPGTFDLASMAEGLFRGVSLFAVLPGPIEPVQTIEALLETARELARDLSGTLQDAKGMPFSPQRAEALLKDVARFQALLV
jgi:cell division protein ZipA